VLAVGGEMNRHGIESDAFVTLKSLINDEHKQKSWHT
jgi:hypothetical protein